MRLFHHSLRLMLAGAAILAIGAPSVLADPMEPYGKAIVPRDSLERRRVQPAHPVITNDLMEVIRNLKAHRGDKARASFAAEVNEGRPRPLFVLGGENSDEIEVNVWLYEKSDVAVDELEDNGMDVQVVSSSRPLVEGFVALDDLERIASLANVRQIRRPNYSIATAGAVTTQGDITMATNVIRLISSLDGTGQLVAVASNGLFDLRNFSPTPLNSLLHLSEDPEKPEGLRTELPVGRFADEPIPESGYYGSVQLYPATLDEHYFPQADFQQLGTTYSRGVEDEEYSFFPEGSAMMEVIHDIAPSANMIYVDGDTELRYEESRQFLLRNFDTRDDPAANIRGIDVYVDNLFFTGVGRYDGSSVVSQAATRFSRIWNIPYFMTSGGQTPPDITGVTRVKRFPMQITSFFNGDPRDDRVKVHSWSGNTGADRDEALSIDGNAREAIEVSLVWDDFWDDLDPRATVDLDLYLVPRDTLALDDAVASSINIQNGNASNPVERLTYVPPSDISLALILVNKNAGQNARFLFTLVIEQGQVSESKYLTHGVPLNNSDALPPVISVGHIDLTITPNSLGFDINPGLTPGDTPSGGFIKWFEGQSAPDVVSYSSVHTVTTSALAAQSPTAFGGPSAAVAHLGGFAALLRHRYPEMPSYRMYELFRDMSGRADNGIEISPFATDITPATTKTYYNAPTYRRVNPLAIFQALNNGYVDPFQSTSKINEPVASPTEEGWTTEWASTADPTYLQFDLPEYRVSAYGLEMRATSDYCFGYWESPVLTVQTAEDAEPRTELRADRIYMAEVRVGANVPSPAECPQFRMRLMSVNGDESAMVAVKNVSEGVVNVPETLGGRLYRVFYQPSNEDIARQGVRFYFDLLNFDPDADQNTTVVMRDMRFVELTPEEAAALR